MSAVLLTRLKITDLTALTALEAGRRMLPEGRVIERLTREEVVLFEPETGADSAAFETKLREVVESSNFFVNPNKERHRFLAASERGASWAPHAGSWGILARSLDDTADVGLLHRLSREHPLPGLAAIRRARVWWLWTKGPNGDPAASDFYEWLGPLVGPKRGLLVNPHAESSRLIAAAIPWRDVERFLVEPATAATAV